MSGKENGVLGSLMNGLGTNALAGNDPVKGLAINAALLAGSGGLSGLGSAAANTGGMTGANVAGSVAPGAFGAPVAGSAISAANAAPAAGIFSGGGTAALGGISPVTAAGPSTGMIPSSLYQPTFMEKVTGGLDRIGQFTKDYPVASQMAFATGQSLLQQQPQLQSPGLMRGSPIQAQAPQYQVGVPQISLI